MLERVACDGQYGASERCVAEGGSALAERRANQRIGKIHINDPHYFRTNDVVSKRDLLTPEGKSASDRAAPEGVGRDHICREGSVGQNGSARHRVANEKL